MPEYWVVDPHSGIVEVSVLSGGSYGEPTLIAEGTLASPTIPRLTLDLAPLFEGM